MCGIIGQVSYNDKKPVKLILESIAHRGPDGQGEWLSPNNRVYLGHTRLAILDPSSLGKQPMCDASERYTVIFNGEIYNHKDLRCLLPNIAWRSNSDTETLVELYAAFELNCLENLKGMFAFAIHDAEDDSVILVRDRLGIKPLWTKKTADSFSFSSEIRSLLSKQETKPNALFLSEYVGFGRVAGLGEILEGIASVAPGSWIRISKTGQTEKTTWWPTKNFTPKKNLVKQEAKFKIKQLVTKAVKEHLISDVGVGAFLSGGVDSSILTIIAGKELGKELKTFTVGFSQSALDERAIAKKVAQISGSEHFEIEIQEQDCLDWVIQAVNSLDLPSVDAINTYIVSKAVRDTGLKVALSGLGGDELFAGYPSFKNIPRLSWLDALPNHTVRKLMKLAPTAIQEKLEGLSNYDTFSLTRNRRRFTGVATLRKEAFGFVEEALPKSPMGLDTLATISWAEIQSYMIPMLLRDSDQMSMAVGLEIRVPFLDHILVEEVLSMPQRIKKGKCIKPLLVDAFKDILPREVYNRPKQGFELPMKDWIQGPLAAFSNSGIEAASDWLSSELPLRQKKKFDVGQLHWTRVWHWSILGHWLKRQNLPSTIAS